MMRRLCKSCEGKLIMRGFKTFKCTECGENDSNYMQGIDMCTRCLDKKSVCRMCGEPIDLIAEYKALIAKKQQEFDAAWYNVDAMSNDLLDMAISIINSLERYVKVLEQKLEEKKDE